MTLVTFKLSDYNLTPNAHITFYPTTTHNDSDVLVGKTPFGVPFTTNTTVELESTTSEWVWRILISDNLTPIKDGFYRVPNQDTIPFTELTSASPLDIEPDNPWLSMARSTVSWAEIVDGELILSRTDGKTINVGNVVGEPGEDGGIGKSVTVAAGSVTKLPPGSQPTASLTGSLTAKTLNLGLVTGDTGQAGSNVLPTNTAVANAINEEGATKTALNAAIVEQLPDMDLVSKLKAPMYISHRGGLLRYPEHSMEAYRASAQAGYMPEIDVGNLVDNTLVCIHDETVERTMTGVTGRVDNLTTTQWKSARIKPAIAGGDTAIPVFWDDVLNEFGGRTVLLPEIHDYSSIAVDRFIESIISRGLQRAVIAQSFTYALCKRMAAAGIAALYLVKSGELGTADPATMVADGIEFVGPPLNESKAYFDSFKAVGIRVIPYTAGRKAEADLALFTKGAFGVFTDDPWALSGNYLTKKSQTYNDGVKWIGSQGSTTNDSLVALGGNQFAHRIGNLGALRYVEQGWAGVLPVKNLTIEVDVKFTAQNTASGLTDSLRIYLSQSTNMVAVETQNNWIQAMIRRSGNVLTFRKRDGGVITQSNQFPNFIPPLTDFQESPTYRLKINIDAASDVTVTREGGAVVANILNADSGLSSASGLWLSTATANTGAEFSNWLLKY